MFGCAFGRGLNAAAFKCATIHAKRFTEVEQHQKVNSMTDLCKLCVETTDVTNGAKLCAAHSFVLQHDFYDFHRSGRCKYN